MISNDTLIAVDLAKSVFEVAVSQQPALGARRQVLTFFVHHPPATVIMEVSPSCYLLGLTVDWVPSQSLDPVVSVRFTKPARSSANVTISPSAAAMWVSFTTSSCHDLPPAAPA